MDGGDDGGGGGDDDDGDDDDEVGIAGREGKRNGNVSVRNET